MGALGDVLVLLAIAVGAGLLGKLLFSLLNKTTSRPSESTESDDRSGYKSRSK
jgi:hypothetical protein